MHAPGRNRAGVVRRLDRSAGRLDLQPRLEGDAAVLDVAGEHEQVVAASACLRLLVRRRHPRREAQLALLAGGEPRDEDLVYAADEDPTSAIAAIFSFMSTPQ